MIADLELIKYKMNSSKPMDVDKVASPKSKLARSTGRSPNKNEQRVNPHATPAKADGFRFGGALKPISNISGAHIENIQRIAAGENRQHAAGEEN